MAKTRFELDLTRNSIRQLESMKEKLQKRANDWNDIDFFMESKFEKIIPAIDETISEIQCL